MHAHHVVHRRRCIAGREGTGTQEKRTAGEILSDLARQALTNQNPQPAASQEDAFHGFEPLPHRGGAVSNALIDRLRDEEAV